MFIKDYIQLLLKRWWIVTLAFVVVLAATYVWTKRQTPVYESHATYVIRPRSDLIQSNDFLRALDTMSNRTEINLTFAEVASSTLMRDQAIAKLGLSQSEQRGLSANGGLIGGTNILEITAQGYNPEVTRNFANAVGAATVDYVKNLYDIYQLEVLDAAKLPTKPVTPDLGLNLILGAFLGLALGAAVVFVVESLKPTYKELDTFNIIDRETGAYNKSYLAHRLFQEMARSKRLKSPLALGMVKVKFQGDHLSETEQVEALRTVKILAEKAIRDEDILARFNGTTFAIIFPDLQSEAARETMENVRQAIGSVAHDIDASDGHAQMGSYAAVVSYTGGRSSQERLVEQALGALEQARPE